MTEPILQLRDVTVLLGGARGWLRKTVAPVRAVDGVSLSIAAGEVLALVGESGCGKTTLGRAVLGLQRETAGEIRLDGRLVSGLTPTRARKVRSDVQYVHQDAAAALDPWWSIGATLREGLLIHGVRSARERAVKVDAMLESVGLEPDAGRRYPHEFSGGQLRRVALARILLLQPRLLVLDEPTSGLGHVGAGNGAEPAAGPAAAAGTDLSVHLPRPVGGGAAVGPGGDHVSRPDRGMRANSRGFRTPGA